MDKANLLFGSRVSATGRVVETCETLIERLCNGDIESGIDWFEASQSCVLEVAFPEPVRLDMVVCRWAAMPAEYAVEVLLSGSWTSMDSVENNPVLGPRVRVHLFAAVKSARLRIRIGKFLEADLHGRVPCGWVSLSGMEICATDHLPAHIQNFLNRPTPRLVNAPENLAESRPGKRLKPDPSWLDAEIPTWKPIPKELYFGKETGKEINEKNGWRNALMAGCAEAYVSTGDERYAAKARQVMMAIVDHYQTYQSFRFIGIGWKAVTFQDPAYFLRDMVETYDLLATSVHLTLEDRLRFAFFCVDLGEFQYLALRDRFEARENWAACSLAEMVFLALYFKGFPEADRWVAMSDACYPACFEPFLPDGYWWECSPAHSVYMLRGMCRYAVGKHLMGDPAWQRSVNGMSLEFVLEALCKTLTPFGEYPSINDSCGTDGHLLTDYPELRAPFYLIGRGDLLRMLKDSGEPPFLPGAKIHPISQKDPQYTSVLLPHAGFAVMRDGWDREDGYLIFDYGPHGGSHGHPDKLGFVLFANGHHWIPDAGDSPHYSIFPEQKTWHKQTVAHNTVLANNQSQQPCTGDLIFWHSDAEVDAVCAQHTQGYEGLTHRRTIVRPRNGYVLVHDVLHSDGIGFNLEWLLHIYGEVEAQEPGRLWFRSGQQGLLLVCDAIGEAPVEIHQGLCGGFQKREWKAPGYPPKGGPGWIYIPYIRLKQRLDAGGQAEYLAVLVPFAGDRPEVQVERVDDAAGWAAGVRIACKDTEDVYAGASAGYDAKRDGNYVCGGESGCTPAIFVRKKRGKPLSRKLFTLYPG